MIAVQLLGIKLI